MRPDFKSASQFGPMGSVVTVLLNNLQVVNLLCSRRLPHGRRGRKIKSAALVFALEVHLVSAVIYKRNKTYHVDVTVNGTRYRESLKTTNWQEAQRLQKELIARILDGKAAAPVGKGGFANLPLQDALEQLVSDREGRVAERTSQIDKERAKVVKRHLGNVLVRKIDATTIREYQDRRKKEGVSGRTINLEVTLIRQVLKRAKRWSIIADEISNLPEPGGGAGRALTRADKLLLFRTAASKPEWEVAFCAGVIAVNTTCRKVELLTLRWLDVDLLGGAVSVARSKTKAGYRQIPLNSDAIAAFVRLKSRSKILGSCEPNHFVFPGCENGNIDPSRHQKTFRTAWRSLVKEVAERAGNEAARIAIERGHNEAEARKAAIQPFIGYRFHDLRHQSITEMAEAGVPEAAMQSIAGHVSKKMLDHYSHIRVEAKRKAVAVLGGGLIDLASDKSSQDEKTNVN